MPGDGTRNLHKFIPAEDFAAAILTNEIIQSLGFTVFPVLKLPQIIVDLIE